MEELLARVPLLLLVSSRVAGVTAVSPVFANPFVPAPLRAALTFLLALLILPAVANPAPSDDAQFLLAILLELLVGLVIGFLGQMLFAVVQMAGSLLDMDMGLSMAQIADPVSGHSEPVLGSFFRTLALVLYFGLNAHHWLLRGLTGSYEAIPAGEVAMAAAGYSHVVFLFGAMLAAAVKMVLPFLAVMMMTTAVLAGISRAVPQMQIFQVGWGIKTIAGLLMLAMVLPYLIGFLEPLFADGQTHLLRTLELMR